MQAPSDLPPPYPGLPSYKETVLVDNTDSLRLPHYQARTGRRYHPYRRIKPSEHDPLARYKAWNTIFDESYTPFTVLLPGHSVRTTLVNIPPVPTVPPPLPPVNPPPRLITPDALLTPEERHRRRILRLFHLIPEFVRAVEKGLEAAENAATGDSNTALETPANL